MQFAYVKTMVVGSKLFGSMFLVLCASIGCAGFVHAQGVWSPITLVGGPTNIVTTGGITYAQYAWVMGGCMDLISNGPLIEKDGNFSYDFEIELETGVACPQFVFGVSTTAVLDALAPGNYTLTTTSWSVPVATNDFTVPTNSMTTLQPVGFGVDGSFNIQLTGVPGVNYVLQRSTNLVNWTSLSINSVGTPLSDNSPILLGPCYYRVQIIAKLTAQ
jgi:hypothetical protein